MPNQASRLASYLHCFDTRVWIDLSIYRWTFDLHLNIWVKAQKYPPMGYTHGYHHLLPTVHLPPVLLTSAGYWDQILNMLSSLTTAKDYFPCPLGNCIGRFMLHHCEGLQGTPTHPAKEGSAVQHLSKAWGLHSASRARDSHANKLP